MTGEDLLTVRGQRVLVTNRMPTDDGGAVATLRDRTELERLGRELDSTRGLIDALRAQDHEHANRMHTLLGLLELGMHEEAVEFVTEVAGVHRATAEQITEKIHDPLLAALLVGKATVAAERGVALRLSDATLLPDRLVDPRGLVTVVGNLVDNALDASAGSPDARIEVELRARGAYGRTAGGRQRTGDPGRAAGADLHGGVVDQGAARTRQARSRPRDGAPAGGAAGRQRPGRRGGGGRRRIHRRTAGGSTDAGLTDAGPAGAVPTGAEPDGTGVDSTGVDSTGVDAAGLNGSGPDTATLDTAGETR